MALALLRIGAAGSLWEPTLETGLPGVPHLLGLGTVSALLLAGFGTPPRWRRRHRPSLNSLRSRHRRTPCSIGAFASTHGTRRTLRRRAPVWTKNSDLILTRRSAVLRSPCRAFHVAQERARCAAALADRFEILSIVVGRLNRHRIRSDASTVLHDGISHTRRYARGNPNVISTTEGRPKFGSKVNQGRPAPLESTNGRPWLLSIEYRECR